MKAYPAIKARMGHPEQGWEYYMVKMKMKDLSANISFVSELSVPKSLADMLQRAKDDKRVKNAIKPYLQERPDRFFSSIIVACLGGNAKFHPVQIADTDNDVMNELNKEAEDSLGVLTLSGGEKYYALDGQHRLGAIKEIIEKGEWPSDSDRAFEEEDISVLILRAREADEASASESDQWYRMFRRVFTSLNRWTKPTNQDTNIIMDDDDLIAITTRELIETFGPFQWEGKVEENAVIQLSGKNITGESKPHLTTLQTLYAMNEVFLQSFENEEKWVDLKKYKTKRPPEEFIDKCNKELKIIWQSLFDSIPDLSKDPKFMRVNEEVDSESNMENNFFFRPIVQEYILAPVIRTMIDNEDLDIDEKVLTKKFQKLNKLPSSLFSPPWRKLLIVLNEKQNWIIRPAGSDAKSALKLARDFALWITEVTEIDKETEEEFKSQLKAFMPEVSHDAFEEMWKEVLKIAK